MATFLRKSKLAAYDFEGEKLWGNPETELSENNIPTLLLPAFDEYVIPYQNRGIVLNEGQNIRTISHNGMFYPLILEKGKLVGTWKRTLKKSSVKIEVKHLGEIGEIAKTAQTYGQFLGKTVEMP